MNSALQENAGLAEQIRKHFPALQRVHQGRPVAYFDGPGGTQVPRSVAEAMVEYLLNHNANECWSFLTSVETLAVVNEARQAIADFLNAHPNEIVFGQNMTSLTMHVSRAIGRELKPGDQVIVTELDHHANVDSWKQMAQDCQADVQIAKMIPDKGILDWKHLESLINPRTKLLAIGASSNALGTLNDVRHAADLAHAVGAYLFVDAVHYAPHHLVDVRQMDCDFLVCSAYKFYGPHLGALYGRSSILERLDIPKLQPASNTAPKRIETGTQSFESMAGTTAAINFLASLGHGKSRRVRLVDAFSKIHLASTELFEQLWNGLAKNPRITLFGLPPGDCRTSTISFVVDGYPSEEISKLLSDQAILVSHGNFYAATVIQRLGYEKEGVVRVGLSCYSNADEVDRLLDALPK